MSGQHSGQAPLTAAVRKARVRRTVSAGLGVVYVAAALVVVLVAVLVYDKAFTDTVDVTLKADSVGNALQKGSDVKVRGVPVGRVTEIDPSEGGATIHLQLQPDKAKEIPASTTARLLPKTLFGERYVSLADSSDGASAGDPLRSGDTVMQDTSSQAQELEQLFDQLLPLLTAVQPEKISATLSEIATALRGQGGDLGDTLSQAGGYLTKLNPDVPQLARDLDRLGTVAQQYDDAVPDLLAGLDDLSVTSRTIADQRQELSAVYATVASASDTTRGFLVPNEDTIVVVSQQGRRALDAVAPYASTFPCTLKALREFIPRMDTVLGKGTKEPGLHATLTVTDAPAPYRPGKDAVRYSRKKAACPYFPGARDGAAGSLATAATPTVEGEPSVAKASAARSLASAQAAAGEGLGKANSPAENQLIAELVAPGEGKDPATYPRWSSLLLGPTMRGRTVAVS
ncbi:ABC transporter substrate-binding protein [Marmoricola endophyticus]|uniref:ABC transporter substrate-binding protein n=1 Tax=Marmoricola endophyticus TaxID=2040280 RepID=A0A917BEA9_9ACTN|nr:MCE family protein [Marmoricola endophyticus]GGF37504.1 ABC transporter substrate-binding protein [Marmoricola endophyticus]